MQEEILLTTRNINWKFEPVLTDFLIDKWLTQKNISNSYKISVKIIKRLQKDFIIEELKKNKNEIIYQYFTPSKRSQHTSRLTRFLFIFIINFVYYFLLNFIYFYIFLFIIIYFYLF